MAHPAAQIEMWAMDEHCTVLKPLVGQVVWRRLASYRSLVEHLWPLTSEALINTHFADLDALVGV